MSVEEVVRHQDFQWLTVHSPLLGANTGHPSGLGLFEDDIAVLKVNSSWDGMLCEEKKIWPACLPSPGVEYAGWHHTGLAGWGKTDREGDISKVLMNVEAPIINDDYCERKVGMGSSVWMIKL